MRITADDNVTPLTPHSFYILLALLEKPHYGYSLVRQIEHDSGGIIQINPGSIYKALDRLEALLLISTSRTSASERSPHMRKHYRLTPYGKQILQLETKRLVYASRLVKDRLASEPQRREGGKDKSSIH